MAKAWLAVAVFALIAFSPSSSRPFSATVGFATDSGAVTTVDDTETVVVYLDIPQNTSGIIDARVVARSGDLAKMWHLSLLVRRGTGGVTFVGNVDSTSRGDHDAKKWNATIDLHPSSNFTLRLLVTGVPSTTIDWSGGFNVQYVGTAP